MQIAQFTAASLEQTKAEWVKTAVELDIGELEYQVNLDWAAQRIDYKNAKGDAFVYGIFDKPGEPAVAIAEIVYSQRPGPKVGLLKMLQVILCPKYSPSQMDGAAEIYKKVLDIYAEAIKGTVELTGNHKAKVVKIFGRNNELLQLLYALNERLNNLQAFPLKSVMEGRWLKIESK